MSCQTGRPEGKEISSTATDVPCDDPLRLGFYSQMIRVEARISINQAGMESCQFGPTMRNFIYNANDGKDTKIFPALEWLAATRAL